ncbi:Premnaspirodiene oxygenase [Linum grandiflorum]
MASSITPRISLPSTNLTSPRHRLKLLISSKMSKTSDDQEINKLQYRHRRLPPGPMKLPLIGNLHNLLMSSKSSLPHHALRDLADEYGDLLHLQLGEVSAVVVSSAEMAREVMKTHDHVFADRPRNLAVDIGTWGSQDIAFCPLGDYWRQMKRISITDLLGAKKVQSFAPIRKAEVSKLMSSIRCSAEQEGLNPINISEKIYSLFKVIICKTAFGSNEWKEENLINSMREAAMVTGGFHVLDFYPSLEFLHVLSGLRSRVLKLRDHKDGMLDKVIEEHKRKMTERRREDESVDDEDFVDVLVRLQMDEKLQCPITNTSIKAVLVDMFVAGTDTSSVAVEWAMSEIMKNPRVLSKVQNEIRHAFKGKATITEEDVQGLTYLKSVIKETFRLHPSIPLLIPRESNQDCIVGGYKIPSKTRVIVNAWAIGRDPKTWDDPESFNPERFDDGEIDFKGKHFELIPFGAGKRICPGISYAIANIELLLAHLLYHFDWELPDGVRAEDLDMSEVFGLAVGRKNQLHLVAKPFDPMDECNGTMGKRRGDKMYMDV